MPQEIVSAIRTGEIGERHARRALLKVGDPEKQIEIFKRGLRPAHRPRKWRPCVLWLPGLVKGIGDGRSPVSVW